MIPPQTIRIPSYSVDEDKRLRLTAFMEYAQQAAEDDCEAAGFGNGDLLEKGCAWVIVEYHIVLRRMPLFKETVSIQSWHSGVEGPSFLREYEMRDGSGEVLVAANSISCILNLETRRPVRPELFGIRDEENAGRPALETPPSKIRIPLDAVPDMELRRTAQYSDIDYNHHVNNVRYVQWALDCLSPEDLKKVEDITVNYRHEVPPHTEVTLRRYHCGEKIFITGEFGPMQAFSISFSAKK